MGVPQFFFLSAVELNCASASAPNMLCHFTAHELCKSRGAGYLWNEFRNERVRFVKSYLDHILDRREGL
jgi:hypothetical protein